jgi:hypothetical protein
VVVRLDPRSRAVFRNLGDLPVEAGESAALSSPDQPSPEAAPADPAEDAPVHERP